MKRLILLRHAKSSWNNPGLTDRERPLSPRGKKAAPLMGKYLAEYSFIPDRVVCSTAKRTRMTIDLIQQGAGIKLDITYDSRIYDEPEDTIRKIIAKTDDSVETLMVVGHNPDMEEMTEIYTQAELPNEKFSTCAVAVLDFDCNSWKKTFNHVAVLQSFMTPKML